MAKVEPGPRSQLYFDGIETGQQCHNIEAETRQSRHENSIHHGNIKRYPNIIIKVPNNRQKTPCLNDRYLKHSWLLSTRYSLSGCQYRKNASFMKVEHPKNVYLNDVAKTNKQNISC